MASAINYWYQKWLAEKKKVSELEEQINAAKDYAFFAGSKDMQGKLIDKACDAYCMFCGHDVIKSENYKCRQDCGYYKAFRKVMEEDENERI